MKSNLSEIIRREIMNSDLPGIDKLDALVLLDSAIQGKRIKDHYEIIVTLEDLYEKLTRTDYKEALLGAINKYKQEIRTNALDPGEEPVTVKDLLRILNVPLDNIPRETLDLKISIGEDDGMGYTPRGFREVIDLYIDKDLKLWV